MRRAGAHGAQHVLAALRRDPVPGERLAQRCPLPPSRRSSAWTSSSGVSNEMSAEPSRASRARWPASSGIRTLAGRAAPRRLVARDPPAHVRRPRRHAPVGQRAGREAVVRRRVGRRRAARRPHGDVALRARPQEDPRAPRPARREVDHCGVALEPRPRAGDPVARRRRDAAGDRHAVARRLRDRLRRVDAVEVRRRELRRRAAWSAGPPAACSPAAWRGPSGTGPTARCRTPTRRAASAPRRCGAASWSPPPRCCRCRTA